MYSHKKDEFLIAAGNKFFFLNCWYTLQYKLTYSLSLFLSLSVAAFYFTFNKPDIVLGYDFLNQNIKKGEMRVWVNALIESTELCFHKPKVFIFFDIELIIILIPAVT